MECLNKKTRPASRFQAIVTSKELGFKKGEVNKEQIEDLITGNISPRPGPDQFRITEASIGKNSVFVVQVQVGTGEVWQAKDKRYYSVSITSPSQWITMN